MKKKAAIVIGILIIFAVVLSIVYRMHDRRISGNAATEPYIIGKQRNISLKDVESLFEKTDFRKDPRARASLEENPVNSLYTLKLLMSLDEQFLDSMGTKDRLDSVRQYLLTVLPQKQAMQIFGLYKTYLSYEMGLENKKKTWGVASTPEEALDQLEKLQEYRRSIFGREVADTLFAGSVKVAEYQLRRNAIISDREAYGAEKENQLKTLNADLWGEDEAREIEASILPYNRYQEKLILYQRDLSEIASAEKKQDRIRLFREEIFSPQDIRKLEDVDRLMAEERGKEENYAEAEAIIRNNEQLTDEEKKEKIKTLQDETFGNEAEAFRRRQAIREGLGKR